MLSGFFYLLSLFTFLRFYFPGQLVFPSENPIKNRSSVLYGVSLFFFVCALLSKTVTCTLPAVIFLLFWWKQNHIHLKIVQLMAPFFVIGLGFATLTRWLEKVNVGALGSEWDFSFWDRFLIAGQALWFYIGKLIWPFPIIFTYPRWNIDDSVWWQYLYPATFLLLILILWALRNKIGRGPLTAILFFSGSLFPALGFFNIYPMRFCFVADHFQYLASIGILLVIVGGITRLTKKGALASSILLLLFLGYLTWEQVPVYKNVFTLWSDTVQKNPNAWMAHYNLGNLFIAEQKTEEAIAQYREAIRIKPDFVDVYNNWGIALLKEGKNKEAITRFRKALELKPGYADAQNNLKIARRAAGGQRDTPSGHAWYSTIAFMPGTGKGK